MLIPLALVEVLLSSSFQVVSDGVLLLLLFLFLLLLLLIFLLPLRREPRDHQELVEDTLPLEAPPPPGQRLVGLDHIPDPAWGFFELLCEVKVRITGQYVPG